jgi:hypothetical protein
MSPPKFDRGVAEEDLVLGSLDLAGNRNAALYRHLRVIDADRSGRRLEGLDRSHTHRLSHGCFPPLALFELCMKVRDL